MTDLERRLDGLRERHGVAGVAGAIVDNDHVACAAVGRRARWGPGAGVPARAEEGWHIGSCGKSITAVLYARLVEHGLAAWGTPVAELFPDLDAVAPGWSSPTIDDLLRCRAGVAPNPVRRRMVSSYRSPLPASEERTRATSEALARSPRQPGRFRYSNLGYVVAGAAIDRLASVRYEEALRRWVLEPLAIATLGFGPPPAIAGHGPRLRLGPLLAGRGRPAPPDDPRSDNPPVLTPAGRMHLSVPDWCRFLAVFLDGADPFLAPASLDRLLHLPDRGRTMGMGWASAAGLDASYGMQGSNTRWAATALIDRERSRIAAVVANDGRSRVLTATALLARDLLSLDPSDP